MTLLSLLGSIWVQLFNEKIYFNSIYYNFNNYKQIDKADLYSKYQAFVKQKESNFKMDLGTKESRYFENLLLATIARNLWDNDAYYKVISQEDEYIQEAIISF